MKIKKKIKKGKRDWSISEFIWEGITWDFFKIIGQLFWWMFRGIWHFITKILH
jgi:hypothetical protein